MSVSLLPDWRLPGCDDRCRYHRHDPQTHEEYGEMVGAQGAGAPIVCSGPLTIDLTARTAFVDGVEAALSELQWATLEYLARTPNRIVTREALIARIWGREFVHSGRRFVRSNGQSERYDHHMLRVHMFRLRAALGPAASLIATVSRRGYRLDVTP